MKFPSRGFIVVGLFYTLLSVVCSRIPLLNYLGYEFGATLAFIASFVSGFWTIRIVRRAYYAGAPASDVTASFKRALVLNLAAIAIPLVIMSANAMFVRNCSIAQGIAFFALLPVPSVFFGSALGFFCAVHYRVSRTMFVLYCSILLLYSVALGYWTPAIFSYNFLYGYFPGVTYDEALGMSWTLVLFRVLTVLVGLVIIKCALLVLANSAPTDSTMRKGVMLLKSIVDERHRVGTGIVVGIVILVWIFRGGLGLESSSSFIQRTLGSVHTTEHFSIYYSKDSFNDEEIWSVGAEHEFRLQQLADAFFITFHGKLESYVYPSDEVKLRLIGAGGTNIAKPWSGQIHITKQSLDATLKHELVHVVAARFGVPVIRASLRTGLVEGLAEAVDWNWGSRTPHQYAAAMKKFGVLPDIEPLMMITGFAAQASSVSYVVCGSFCRFLIDRYGMRKMTQVYRTGNFQSVYGRSFHQLSGEWRGFLDRIPVPEQDRDIVDVLFRQPPIFRKVCARVVAERNLEAGKKFAAGDYATASSLYKRTFDETGNYNSLGGYVNSALRSGEYGSVTTVLDSVVMNDNHPGQYLPLFLTMGIASWAQGEEQRAKELFQRLETADIGESFTESAKLCRFSIDDATNNSLLLRYFLTVSNDTLRSALLDSMTMDSNQHWVPMYVKGKVCLRMKQYADAADLMQALGHVVADHDSVLESIRLKTIGRALFSSGEFQPAKMYFWQSLNFLSTEVALNSVNTWVERCDWMEQYKQQ